MKQNTDNQGFTLIEVMIAMAVLAIGIIALYAMQAAATKGNAFAFNQTVAANLGMNQVEMILAAPYTKEKALDNDVDDDRNGTIDDAGDYMLGDLNPQPESGAGVAGLDDTLRADGTPIADYNTTVQDEQGVTFNIYWNIAEDSPMLNVKTIRVIVTRRDMGALRPVALTYYKQNPF